MSEPTLQQLANAEWLLGPLQAAGLAQRQAERKAQLFARAAAELLNSASGAGADAPLSSTSPLALFVPGRIEVLGKHTDYAGGRTLVAACEQGFCAVAVPQEQPVLTVLDVCCGRRADAPLSADVVPRVGHWSNYLQTVVRRLVRNFGDDLRGVRLAFLSDLPPASGMSSSSALIILASLVLLERNRLHERPLFRQQIRTREDLAGYLATVENGQSFGLLAGDRGVGTFGGSEDHTAILCARPGTLLQYSYCPVRFERAVEVSSRYVFAIGVSGVRAEKTGAARELYNRASRLASAAAEVWRAATGDQAPHLGAIVRSSPNASERLRRVLSESANSAATEFSPEELTRRVEHFVAESEELLPAVPDRLDGPEALDCFGRLCDRSQELAESLLGNQVEQTSFLARTARDLGAFAASAFGAGFGGSVWALVPADGADDWLAQWQQAYERRYGELKDEARFFLTRPAPSAFAVGRPCLLDELPRQHRESD